MTDPRKPIKFRGEPTLKVETIAQTLDWEKPFRTINKQWFKKSFTHRTSYTQATIINKDGEVRSHSFTFEGKFLDIPNNGFDLENYEPFDPTKPVQTADGMPVSLISQEGRGKYPLIGYIGDSDVLRLWDKYGNYDSRFPQLNLVNVPERTLLCVVNVYKDRADSLTASDYTLFETVAETSRRRDCLEVVKIYREGDKTIVEQEVL